MIARFDELLAQARDERRAVGAFTCYTLEGAAGVLRAAEEAGQGVVLLLSAQAFAAAHGSRLLAMLLALARQASVPAAVQLDHTRELALIRRAFAGGAQAAMADGSHLPVEENVAFVRAAVAIAREHGGQVEAELAGIGGDEEHARAASADADALTDPEQAGAFVADSGAACLAVAIGNVHGRYAAPPRLDLARLERIAALVDAPLALHGASGLPDADVRATIARGIAKVNVNTELREALFDGMAELLPAARPSLALLDLGERLVERVAAVTARKLALLDAAPPPAQPPL